MIKRTFITIEEAIARLGGDKLLLEELVELHGLCFYHRLSHVRADQHWDEGPGIEDTLARSGKHELAHWSFRRKLPGEYEPDDDPNYYVLNGWFQVTDSSSRSLLNDHAVSGSVYSYVDGNRYGIFHSLSEDLYRRETRVRLSELEAFVRSDPPSPTETQAAEIGSREKNNLLRIIVALAKQARIDLAEGGKGALQIEAAVSQAGFESGPKEKTIRKVLAQIRSLEP